MAAPAWFDADWPAPPGVRALTTLRSGEGASPAPLVGFAGGSPRIGRCQRPESVRRIGQPWRIGSPSGGSVGRSSGGLSIGFITEPDERPVVIAVKKAGQALTKEELIKFYEGKIAKWWMPDDVVFVDELPHTATGKLSKLTLREKFKDYRLPTA